MHVLPTTGGPLSKLRYSKTEDGTYEDLNALCVHKFGATLGESLVVRLASGEDELVTAEKLWQVTSCLDEKYRVRSLARIQVPEMSAPKMPGDCGVSINGILQLALVTPDHPAEQHVLWPVIKEAVSDVYELKTGILGKTLPLQVQPVMYCKLQHAVVHWEQQQQQQDGLTEPSSGA